MANLIPLPGTAGPLVELVKARLNYNASTLGLMAKDQAVLQKEREQMLTGLAKAYKNRLGTAQEETANWKVQLSMTTDNYESLAKQHKLNQLQLQQQEKKLESARASQELLKKQLEQTTMRLDWAMNGHDAIGRDLQAAHAINSQLHASLSHTYTELANTQKDLDESRIENAYLTHEIGGNAAQEVHDELQTKLEHATKQLTGTQEELHKAHTRINVITSAPHLKKKTTSTLADSAGLRDPVSLNDAKLALAAALRDLTSARSEISEFKPTCDKTATCNSCIYHLRKSLAISRAGENAANALVDKANIQRAAAWSELQDYKIVEARYPVLMTDIILKEEAVQAAERRSAAGSDNTDDEAPVSETYRSRLKELIQATDSQSDRDSGTYVTSDGKSTPEQCSVSSEDDMAESDRGLTSVETADQAVVLQIEQACNTTVDDERGSRDLISSSAADTASVSADDAASSKEAEKATTCTIVDTKEDQKHGDAETTEEPTKNLSVCFNLELSVHSEPDLEFDNGSSFSSDTRDEVHKDEDEEAKEDEEEDDEEEEEDEDEDDDDSIIFILESPLATAHAEMKIKKLPSPEPQDRAIDAIAAIKTVVPKDNIVEERKTENKDSQAKSRADGSRFVQQTFKRHFLSGLVQPARAERGNRDGEVSSTADVDHK